MRIRISYFAKDSQFKKKIDQIENLKTMLANIFHYFYFFK